MSTVSPGDLFVEVCQLFVSDGHGSARRLLGQPFQGVL